MSRADAQFLGGIGLAAAAMDTARVPRRRNCARIASKNAAHVLRLRPVSAVNARYGIPLLHRGNQPTLLDISPTFGVLVRQLAHHGIEVIAAKALFTASPAASHVTAQTIHVNGGLRP